MANNKGAAFVEWKAGTRLFPINSQGDFNRAMRHFKKAIKLDDRKLPGLLQALRDRQARFQLRQLPIVEMPGHVGIGQPTLGPGEAECAQKSTARWDGRIDRFGGRAAVMYCYYSMRFILFLHQTNHACRWAAAARRAKPVRRGIGQARGTTHCGTGRSKFVVGGCLQ